MGTGKIAHAYPAGGRASSSSPPSFSMEAVLAVDDPCRINSMLTSKGGPSTLGAMSGLSSPLFPIFLFTG